MPEIRSIGHSTHSLEQFIALLTDAGIELLVDVRRFPGSRKFPHFNREMLAAGLQEAGIGYHWMEALGGRRKSATALSPNQGLRNESFRNYADYMATLEFEQAINELLKLAGERRTAIMCSESVFWRCHRRLIADYLLTRGITVMHIMPSGELHPHTLTEGARIASGRLTYPAPQADQQTLPFHDDTD